MREFVVHYWVEVFFGVITAIMAYVIKQLNKKIAQQESIKLGVQALLRDRIIEKYDKAIEEGYCPIHIRDSMIEMSIQYYNLGGNGVVNTLMEKIQYLPTTPPEDDNEGV